jgi:hypothetical protein
MRTPEMDTNLVETRGEPLKALFCGKQPLSSAYERATRARHSAKRKNGILGLKQCRLSLSKSEILTRPVFSHFFHRAWVPVTCIIPRICVLQPYYCTAKFSTD